MFIIFILGFFIDYIEIAVIVVPIIAPILLANPGANISALWFGVMVERTRARCRRVRVEHLTRVERAAAESIPLPDHSQDVVVSVNNIQLWSDRAVGLDECVRVLVPGGALVVLFHTWAMPDTVPTVEWIAELTTDLSNRGVRVELSQIQRFRSGPALVLAGRLA